MKRIIEIAKTAFPEYGLLIETVNILLMVILTVGVTEINKIRI